MRGKLWFVGGVAVGFVLGARAGREKYEELVLNARKLWDHPTVQEAAGVVQAQASRLYEEGKGTVTDKLSHTRLGERLSTSDTSTDTELAGASTGTKSTTATSTSATPSKPKSANSNTTF